ncbi:MAG TPA: hypothetical protein DD473_03125 [Planctomycetaceae bacterium]|nr:hypothetical protein [Planctomycetaceae bacterium]
MLRDSVRKQQEIGMIPRSDSIDSYRAKHSGGFATLQLQPTIILTRSVSEGTAYNQLGGQTQLFKV